MKESGIDWIGQIPEEWEVTKLKYALLINNGKDYKDIEVEEGGYPVIGSGGVFARSRNYMYDGDVVLLGRKGTIDKPLFYSGKFWTVDTMFYSTALNGNNIKFMYYSSMLIPFSYYSTATALPSMTQSNLNNHMLCLPSISEQQKIADFLDKKIAQLDKAKALLEEQIQKLRDYRASLIYETVTKGLDKTVPMKDSGIDWIGQIPQGWGVIKFKYLGDVKQGLTYSPSDIVDKDEGILVLRSGNIQNGILDFNNNVYVKTKVAESILLRKNDILITARNGSSALIGKNAIIDTDIKATFGAFMMVFRANKSLFAKFAFYLMNVSFNFYRTFFTTSTVNQLTAAIFNGIGVPLPSIYEQKKITDFLDEKTVQIDKLIQIKNQQIENINKQRQTLIYDYVTGKRRV